MINNNFLYSERLGDFETDNLLQYEAGPINIRISGWDETIHISTTEKWKKLLPEALEIAKLAWEIKDEQIDKIDDKNIKIKYNFNNLKLYISHTIIFL